MKDNQREEEKKKRRAIIIAAIILLLIVGVTIGYAGMSTGLNINGKTDIKKTSWNVHFSSVSVASGSATATSPAAISNSEKTRVDYKVSLGYGEFYQFDVVVVNEGTIDAKLSSVVKSGLSTAEDRFVNYTVTYKNGSEIKTNDVLKAGESTTYTVRVEFDPNTPQEYLPANGADLSLSFETVYVQS